MTIKALIKINFAVFCVLLIVSPVVAEQEKSNENTAKTMLRHYIELRLNDADWKEYSKFIMWPDEPAWDCKWLINDYVIGQPRTQKKKIIIPVSFTRLGLYCYPEAFEADLKKVTIKYELEKYQGTWKVSGPDIDYPEIGKDKVLQSLKAVAVSPSATADQRAIAESMTRKVEESSSRTRSKH